VTKGDWILRAEGVNFSDTIWNTNDLSCIRGASLCLEALAIELQRFLDHEGYTVSPLLHGASSAAFKLNGINESEALRLRDAADAALRARYDALKDRPKPVAFPNQEVSEQAGNRAVELEYEIPSEHMTIMVDVEAVVAGDETAALRWAMIRSRRRQLRSPNVPRSDPAQVASGQIGDKAKRQCPIDPLRFTIDDDPEEKATAIVNVERYPGAQPVPDPDVPKGLKRIRVSRRTADLRSYGRHARREIYSFHLKQALEGTASAPRKGQPLPSLQRLEKAGLFETYDFARSFGDIVDKPDESLPRSLHGKLAYLYFDGNGFSALRDEIADLPRFSAFVRLVNAFVLEKLILRFVDEDGKGSRAEAWCTDGRLQVLRSGGLKWEDRRLFRMETLLFGGEDAALVVPSWLAFDLADFMLDAFSEGAKTAVKELGLSLDPLPSWRVGVLICDARTPTRRGIKAAHALCEDAKKAMPEGKPAERSLSFHISESHDVPELSHSPDAVAELRRGYRDSGLLRGKEPEADKAFSAAGEAFTALLKNVADLKATFPRSQVYRMIEALRRQRESDRADEPWQEVLKRERTDFYTLLKTFSNRSRVPVDVERIKSILPAPGRGPLMRLVVLAELWDYVDPFREQAEQEDWD